MKLEKNDILIFKNGEKIEYNKVGDWVIKEFYDEKLNCEKDDKYTIVDILRPYYYSIKGMESMMNVFSMTLEELRDELRERRLQVGNLIQEIKRKDEIIKKYNDFYNKLMENDYGRRPEDGKDRNAVKRQRTFKESDGKFKKEQ